MDSILVIHIGAGRHSAQQARSYKKLLKSALRSGGLIDASRVIERSLLTNTGYGSSLDRTGEATSDASVIEVANCRILNTLALLNIHDDAYPTECVHQTLRQLEHEYADDSVNRQFGLSKPSVLDYKTYMNYVDGPAHIEAKNRERLGLAAGYKATRLIVKKANTSFEKFKCFFETQKMRLDQVSDVIDQNESSKEIAVNDCLHNHKKRKPDINMAENQMEEGGFRSTPKATDIFENSVEDTVGYIELSTTDQANIRLATSSGGNFFRLPGRTSCAGILGAGIGYSSSGGVEVSCMCSGNGDDIISMNLASYLSETIADTLLDTEDWPELGPLLVARILKKARKLKKTAVDAKLQEITYVGVVLVVRALTIAHLVFCHSTETFYFAFRLKGKSETVLSRAEGPVGEFLYGEYKL